MRTHGEPIFSHLLATLVDLERKKARTLGDLRLGALRAQRSLKGSWRFLRWSVKKSLGIGQFHWTRKNALLQVREGLKSARVRRIAALTLAYVMLSSCSSFEMPGNPESFTLPAFAPELSKPRRLREAPTQKTPWVYVLPVDHGVRTEESGKGHFRAPRFHGEHNGIDLLAKVGTPTFAACDGEAIAGRSSSFGNWARVICPVPARVAGPTGKGETPWVSFFYAHLDELDTTEEGWFEVTRGQKLGTVGKTGNARGPNVSPHLHLELIVQSSRALAIAERHLGHDQKQVPDALRFVGGLEDTCLDPLGFTPKEGGIHRARRVDPFVALVCLSPRKPSFEKPGLPLEVAAARWSDYYQARDFNVNRGPRPSLLP